MVSLIWNRISISIVVEGSLITKANLGLKIEALEMIMSKENESFIANFQNP